MKALVVYYSRTGNTRRAAERIAQSVSADLEELKEETERSGLRGYVSGGRDALRRRPAALLPVERDPSAYDLVIVGSPIWAFTLCPAVRTYLMQSAAAIKRAAFFCTHGGGGPSRAYADAEMLLGQPLVATLSLRDRAVKSGDMNPLVDPFIQSLGRTVV